VYESDRVGGGSVMVWAGICHDGRTQLKIVQGTLIAVKYRDDILDPIALGGLRSSVTCVTTALHLRRIEPIDHCRIKPCWMLFHSCTIFNMTMQDVTWLVFVETF
jgi:hypothetical protein